MKPGADKMDKHTSVDPTKPILKDNLETDRDTIPSNRRLDDNVINESQKLSKKQFSNIGGWQDTLLSGV